MSPPSEFSLFHGRFVLAGARLGGFWLAALAVAVVLLVVLYREERRLVSRRLGLGLLGLRLAAALVLVLILFEPIAARSRRETVRGRVIVAVDVSESMETADPGRPAGDRARLARVLGAGVNEMGAMPRREVARRLLAAPESPIGRVAAGHAVEAITFARDATPTTLAAIASASKSQAPGNHENPARLTTDWNPVLAAALRQKEQDGDLANAAPVAAVVLLTDGRRSASVDHDGDGDGDNARRLAARRIPVYSVLIGSEVPPRDAAIAAVRVPEGVYEGDTADVAVTLKLDGYAGREVAVTLRRPGAEVQRRTVVAPEAGKPRAVVSFRVPMAEAGTVPLTIAVEPLEGDVRPDNDRRVVTVPVAGGKAAVLVVDAEARWEFRYLRNALARDPRVNVQAVVFHQPEASGVSARLTYPADLPEALGGFDAVVLGDVDPADLPAAAWERMESYVAERGGTLVLGAGPRFAPALVRHQTARKLLPVLDPRPVPVPVSAAGADPAHPSLPPGTAIAPAAPAGADASTWPMLQLAAGPGQSRAVWAGLPRLPWVLAGRAKPGATALVTVLGDESAVIIAAQPYGLGKVLWVGTDGTWRWRHRIGDLYHHRFWGQAVRWAASGKLAAGNAFVRFGPVRPRVAAGDDVRIQARIAEGIAGAGADLIIAARIVPAGAGPNAPSVGLVPLRPLAGQPRTYEGTAPALPAGAYAVRLEVPELAGPLKLDSGPGGAPLQANLDVVTRETSERIELAAARNEVDTLAAQTGGRVLADSEADQLSSLLRARTHQSTRTEEVALWDHPGILLVLATLLAAEWVARKQAGLP